MLCKAFSLNAKDDSSLVMARDCLRPMIAESPGFLPPVHCKPSVLRATCSFLEENSRQVNPHACKWSRAMWAPRCSPALESVAQRLLGGLFFFLLKCFLSMSLGLLWISCWFSRHNCSCFPKHSANRMKDIYMPEMRQFAVCFDSSKFNIVLKYSDCLSRFLSEHRVITQGIGHWPVARWNYAKSLGRQIDLRTNKEISIILYPGKWRRMLEP